jgi:hypothetical protein
MLFVLFDLIFNKLTINKHYRLTLTALLAAAVCVTLKLDLTSRLAESTIRILTFELPEKMYLPRLE